MKDLQQIKPGDLVLFKDQQLIALMKPAGMPVQPDKSGHTSLQDLAEIYTKQSLHLINRIDRPVAGVVLLAKNSGTVALLQDQMRQRKMHKTYLAITGVPLPEESGELHHYLSKDHKRKKNEAFAEAKENAQEARLNYKAIAASDRYFLYEINLITGRYHQIRAQLAAMGSPIRGDEKYGFKRANKDRSIDLLCWKISFQHPTKNTPVEITAEWPDQPLWNSFKEE